ncbi:hypothetical protein, partial [uncultured Duncaniella sp.]|uniref:hypothetical protein n=1 Tax=uncultured Duncaniella sp. TaxID=2768039 RepID=UPI0026253333
MRKKIPIITHPITKYIAIRNFPDNIMINDGIMNISKVAKIVEVLPESTRYGDNNINSIVE